MSRRKKITSKPKGCRSPDSKGPWTLQEIIDCYCETYHNRYESELSHWKQCTDNDREILIRAASCRGCDCKKHDHQRRFKNDVLEKAKNDITKVQVSNLTNFDELHEDVSKAIRKIKGIGDLAVYDIAWRIGAHFGMKPDRVYLHSGTKKGAENLAEALKRCGTEHHFNVKDPIIDVKCFPPEFRKLPAGEIENCLCIFKDHFTILK